MLIFDFPRFKNILFVLALQADAASKKKRWNSRLFLSTDHVVAFFLAVRLEELLSPPDTLKPTNKSSRAAYFLTA